MTTPKLPSTRPNAAVASATAEGVDAPKANVDDAARSSAAAEEGAPEDSDADPEADALAVGQQGLLSGSIQDGAAKDKSEDRPWIKNVRCIHVKEYGLRDDCFFWPFSIIFNSVQLGLRAYAILL